VKRRKTKIVCTLGPASGSEAILSDMMAAGMNVARINFSHGTYESNLALVKKVRAIAERQGRAVAILQDLQGPRIRVGSLPPGGMELLEGGQVTLKAGAMEAEEGVVPVPYDRLARDVKKGDRILLEDGTKELEVLDVRRNMIRTKVLLGGRLLAHKGINVPTARLSAEALTDKDERDLEFGLQHNIDYVALSFVREPADVESLREKIKNFLPPETEAPAVIVKIEKHEAIVNFDAILAAADGVMIARGDLGLETPVSLLPLRQKEIIAKCLLAGKPVITATEMLGSMQQAPRPTRAEVTDVANAVIDHTDAVMLSGETAMGRYPVRAVQMMADIIEGTEASGLDDLKVGEVEEESSLPRALAGAAVTLAQRLKAAAILVATQSGFSARLVAALRPAMPIVAATAGVRIFNQLLLVWGIEPVLIEVGREGEEFVRQGLKWTKQKYELPAGSLVVVVSGLRRADGGYDSVLRVMEL
jgi:pyruvate kinase